MKNECIDMLECPYDHFYPLEIVTFLEDKGKIKEGLLYCKECNRWYPIKESIVCIMPDELRNIINERKILEEHKDKIPKQILEHGRPFNLLMEKPEPIITTEDSDKLSEMKARDEHATSLLWWYQKNRKTEIISIKKRLKPSRTDVILDLGCGPGRLTKEMAKDCGKIVCADFSFDSLIDLNENCKNWGIDNYIAILCDASLLPIRDSVFDDVMAIDMLQHLPSDNLRRYTLSNIDRVMKKNGLFIIDVYNHDLYRRKQKKQIYTKSDIHPGNDGKTGYHSNNTIYYYNFDYKELKVLLNTYFRIEELCGILVGSIPLFTGFLSRIIGAPNVDLFLQKTFLSKWLGTLLLARCKKKN